MSLTTRCPACGTMFKVVADQLKIAQGWVRCGQCAEVFDASTQLQSGLASTPLPQNGPLTGGPDVIEAEPGFVEPVILPGAEPEPELEKSSSPQMTPEPPDTLALERSDSSPDSTDADGDAGSWERALLQQEPQFAAPLISESAPDVSDAIARPALTTNSTAAFSARAAIDPDETEAPDADLEEANVEASAEVNAEQEVSFVRDARRRALWKRPLVRGLLGVLLLFLLALLGLQWIVQHKDRLAALDARWTPVLQALCGNFECEIRPPRHIESLVIDSSSFTKTGTDTYRLSFALKNSGDIALEVPSLELTLTDTQDQAVVRRVLLPRQFGVNVLTLAGQSELTGLVSLKVSAAAQGGQRLPSPAALLSPLNVAGYRILAFYP